MGSTYFHSPFPPIGAQNVFVGDPVFRLRYEGDHSDKLQLTQYVREGFKKKNCEKAVRLTDGVDPPLPSPEAVRKM